MRGGREKPLDGPYGSGDDGPAHENPKRHAQSVEKQIFHEDDLLTHMTPQQLAASLATIPPDQLAQMPHSLLYAARAYVPPGQQDYIAGPEHQAFAREATQENPLMAAPIAVGSLVYPAYKALFGGRSGNSFGQVGSGLLGVAQGLGNRFSGLLGQ